MSGRRSRRGWTAAGAAAAGRRPRAGTGAAIDAATAAGVRLGLGRGAVAAAAFLGAPSGPLGAHRLALLRAVAVDRQGLQAQLPAFEVGVADVVDGRLAWAC